MRILFITSSRIGDAVLSTGLLNHINQTYPKAKVTIVCGPLASSLFEGYPNLDCIIPLKKQKHNRHWFDLGKDLWGTKWDMIIDLRNSIVSRVLRGKQKFIYGKYVDQRQHKVLQAARILKLETPPAPKLWFTDHQLQKAKTLMGDDQPIIGIGPTANWIGKTWPVEKFIEVANWLLNDKMPNARIAVFAAPGEEEAAEQLLQSIPTDKAINIIAKTTPGEAAACLSLCDYYIGNDSGLMHCAAASKVKTFGLFGPSYPNLYAPWGDHCDYARTPETFDELINYEGYTPQTAPCLMTSLETKVVIDKIDTIMTM